MRSNGGWSWARGCSVLRVFARACPEPAPSCRRKVATLPTHLSSVSAQTPWRMWSCYQLFTKNAKDGAPAVLVMPVEIKSPPCRPGSRIFFGYPAQQRKATLFRRDAQGPAKVRWGVGANDDAPGRLRYILFRLTTVARPPRTVSSAPRGRSHQRRGNPADWLPSWRGRRPYRKT